MLQINLFLYPTLLIFISLIASFGILFITKIGLRGIIVERCKIQIISKLFDCDFCLSFWSNVAISLLVAAFMNDWLIVLLPIFAAPITRKLII